MKRRKWEDIFTNPETRKRIGQLAGAQYLVYGEVEHPTVTVNRSENKKGKVNYSASAEVRVHHVCSDVSTGEIWKESRETGTVNIYFSSSPPTGDELMKRLVEACDRTVPPFIKILVPDIGGVVLGFDNKPRGGKLVLINLGKNDGVGEGVDFVFFRRKELAITDPKTGAPPILQCHLFAQRRFYHSV